MAKPGNLTMRAIVALFGIPIIIIASLLGKIPFLLLVLFIGTVSYFEYSKMLARRRFFPNRIIGTAAVITVIVNSYYPFTDFQILSLIIVSLLLLIELFRRKESATANLETTLLGIFYIGLFCSAIIKLREFYSDSYFLYSRGGYLIISVLAAIWICDSAAYFIGTAIGKNKIFPRVSPKKSWEGSIAGFVFSILAMIAAKELLLDIISLNQAVIIGLIVGIFGQAGDFVESLIKRDVNIKDSSSILPGHGGIFDRFDSLLFTAPIVYIYLYYFA